MSESCYSRTELRDFALGRIEDSESAHILEHLGQCVDCEDTLTSLESTADSLLNHLRIKPQADTSQPVISPVAAHAIELIKANTATNSLDADGAEPNWSNTAALSPTPQHVRDYRLLEQLGAGGMGTVFRAVHTKLDRVVAIKLLPAVRTRVPNAVERFEREMKAIGRLTHPAIVAATDAGELDGTHFLVMEYVDGIDLRHLQNATGPLSVADACEVIRQAAIGLHYVHEQNLVHRDVKPSNLMLASDGNVKILDLGLALLSNQYDDELTTVGQLMGTLDYMAPEQCDDSHNVDIKADVYSLGATLFKLLTGQAPFAADHQRSPLAKLRAIAIEDAPSIDSLRPELPAGLVSLVASLLAKSPQDRPATPQDVAVRLQEFCEPADLQALATESRTAFEQQVQRHEREVGSHENSEQLGGSVVQPTGRDGRVANSEVMNPQPAKRQSVTGLQGRVSSGVFLKWMVAACVLIASAVTIWIKTDNGTLIVTSDSAATLHVMQGDEVVKTLQIESGENETQIRSGKYKVVLDQSFESLQLDKGSISLVRGKKEFATVTLDPDNKAAVLKSVADDSGETKLADPTIEPLYLGKSYAEWAAAFQAETNAKELERMVPALCKLSRPDKISKTIELIFNVHEKYCSQNNLKGYECLRTAGESISELGEPAIEPVLKKLRDGSSLNRHIALRAICPHSPTRLARNSDLGTVAKTSSAVALETAMLAAASDTDRTVSIMAVSNAIHVFGELSSNWLPHLKRHIDSNKLAIALQIARLEPDNDWALNRLLGVAKSLSSSQGGGLGGDSIWNVRPILGVIQTMEPSVLAKHVESISELAFQPSATSIAGPSPPTISRPFVTNPAPNENDDVAQEDVSSIRIEAIKILAAIGPKATSAVPSLKQLIDTAPVGTQLIDGSAEQFEHTNVVLAALNAIAAITESPDIANSLIDGVAERMRRLEVQNFVLTQELNRIDADEHYGDVRGQHKARYRELIGQHATQFFAGCSTIFRKQFKPGTVFATVADLLKYTRISEYYVAIYRRNLELHSLHIRLENIQRARPSLKAEKSLKFDDRPDPTKHDGKRWAEWRFDLIHKEDLTNEQRLQAINAMCIIAAADHQKQPNITKDTLEDVMFANEAFDLKIGLRHDFPGEHFDEIMFDDDGFVIKPKRKTFHNESAKALAKLVPLDRESFTSLLTNENSSRRQQLAMSAFRIAKVGGKFRSPFEKQLLAIAEQDYLATDAISTAMAVYGHLSPLWKEQLQQMFDDEAFNKIEVAEQLIRINPKHQAAAETLTAALSADSVGQRFFEPELSEGAFRCRMTSLIQLFPDRFKLKYRDSIIKSAFSDEAMSFVTVDHTDPDSSDGSVVTSVRVELLKALETMKSAAAPAREQLSKIVETPKPRVVEEDSREQKRIKQELIKAQEIAAKCLQHIAD